jgi:hypothetical protein
MAVTLNASTSTGYIQTADTSGDLALQSNGTTQFNVTSTGAYGQVKASTAVTTTSGTSVDFTNIPSWVKRITVMLAGVSLSTTASVLLIRIGSGSFEATGYVGGFGLSNSSSAASAGANTTGIYVIGFNAAADTANGAIVITNVSGNLWVAQGNTFRDGAVDAGYSIGSAKTTSGVLDRVQVVLDSTGAFDAGTINILYEG